MFKGPSAEIGNEAWLKEEQEAGGRKQVGAADEVRVVIPLISLQSVLEATEIM